jgi:hypothetical protein
MTQKIINGFPQFFSFTYLSGKYSGTSATESLESHTEIDLQHDLAGDSIRITEEDINLLTVVRDGAILLYDEGFEISGTNKIKIYPGLLENEVIQFKKFIGISGVVESPIDTFPPSEGLGYDQLIQEATVYTDNSQPSINSSGVALDPEGQKTRINTSFSLSDGRVDVYINSSRVSVNDGIWSIFGDNTIELNDDYSETRMKVDIVKQRVG